jgi:hypothetical protein
LRELALAAALQLIRRFVAGIEPARGFQRLDRRRISGEALRLARLDVPIEPQPAQIFANAFDILLTRPLKIGIVETQQESAAIAPREQPVQQRGT